MEDFDAKAMQALADFHHAIEHLHTDSENPHFKSSYASLVAIREAIRPHLNSFKLVVCEGITVDDQSGTMWVETCLRYVPTGHVVGISRIRLPDGTPQALGSAITYYRRYSLLMLCQLAPEDDDGNAATADDKERQEILGKIKGTLVQRFPGQSEAAKERKAELIESNFGTRNWKLVETFSVADLQCGLNSLTMELEMIQD